MGGEQAAILLVGLTHVAGLVVLIRMLMQSGDRPLGLGWWFGTEHDDDPGPPPAPVAPGGSALPLPDAEPSAVRLREPGRIADCHPRPARRPGHAPEPARTPTLPAGGP